MHSPYRASFDEPDGWEAVAEGVRVKRGTTGAVTLRLIEMLSTASHPDWCQIGHSGSVIEGELEIEFANEIVRFQAGDGIVIPPGAEHRHRRRAISNRVRLALVDRQG